MNRIPIILLFILGACGSQDGKNTSEANTSTLRQSGYSDTVQADILAYENENFHFRLGLSEEWQALDSIKANKPIVNLYPEEHHSTEMPLTVHAPADMTIITIAPRGYGTELPSGKNISLAQYDQPLPVSFRLDSAHSKIFLLNNNQSWAYYLVPANPPGEWNNYGFIYAQMAVSDFKTVCIDKETGREVDPANCDPLDGDSISRYGQVRNSDRQLVNDVLRTFKFTSISQKEFSNEIPDTVVIESPRPNETISSPIIITGKARGFWFFEANFPVELKDTNGRLLGRAVAEANGEWMTTDFVSFSAELKFDNPETSGGCLILKKQNASGLPRHERSLTIPVKFEE